MLIIKNDRKLKKFSEKVYMQAPEKTLKAATEEKISKKQKSKDLKSKKYYKNLEQGCWQKCHRNERASPKHQAAVNVAMNTTVIKVFEKASPILLKLEDTSNDLKPLQKELSTFEIPKNKIRKIKWRKPRVWNPTSKKALRRKRKRKTKVARRYRYIAEDKSYGINIQFKLALRLFRKCRRALKIRFTQNNVFCTLKNVVSGEPIFTRSAGRYNLNISKKKLKFNSKLVINSFLKEIKKKLAKKNFVVQLIVPEKLRIATLKLFLKGLPKKSKYIMQIESKKSFNGCRSAKKRRKKNKRFSIMN